MESLEKESKVSELISYCFRDKNGTVLHSLNNDIPMMPASNMKLITAISALKVLGADYQFKTEFKVENGSLNIYGGPTFFLTRGIITSLLVGKIDGKIKEIKFRSTYIDSNNYNSQWLYEDSKYSYQPKITNFFLNENCQSLGTSVSNDDDYDFIHLHEDLFTPVKNPTNYFKKFLREEIEKIPEGTKNYYSESGEIIVTYISNLQDILKHILYESCNFYAEVLFKFLSSGKNNKGSWSKSSIIAEKIIYEMSGFQNANIVDGSGLSKSNLISTSCLSILLSRTVEKYGMVFLSLLPVSGKGTLRNRLKDIQNYEIFAKTGTLFGVSSLSGYINPIGVSFSIFVNNSFKDNKKRQEIIDEILRRFIFKYQKEVGA
jgi:D-alanyl-D-alanine carboxypeptidase/D-alanyl-D-alanine-endopeptidase (penicillin-binding protein 4)